MNNTLCHIPKDTPVLITGATGFTGSVLVRKLVEAGLQVKAIARPTSNIQPFEGLPIEWIRGDVFDPETVKKGVTDAEYIFHVAAAFREAKISDETYYKVHVTSTKLLAQEALKQRNFKRFLHTSTIGVHGHIEEPPADEEYRFAPGDEYQKTKVEAEIWIRDFAKTSNLPLTVIRPAGIYGPGDKRLLKLFKFAKKGFFPLVDKHDTLYHLIHVEDLADFYIFCAMHEKALNNYFICGNAKSTSVKNILMTIADVYKTKVRFVSFPSAPLFILADMCETVCKPFGIEPLIYRRRVAFFTKDRAFDTTKAHTVLGFQEKFNNEKGIRMTAEWYRENGWIK